MPWRACVSRSRTAASSSPARPAPSSSRRGSRSWRRRTRVRAGSPATRRVCRAAAYRAERYRRSSRARCWTGSTSASRPAAHQTRAAGSGPGRGAPPCAIGCRWPANASVPGTRSLGVTCNAHLPGPLVRHLARLDLAPKRLLSKAVDSMALTGRGFDRALKVARTVADLAGLRTSPAGTCWRRSRTGRSGRRTSPVPDDAAPAPTGYPDGFVASPRTVARSWCSPRCAGMTPRTLVARAARGSASAASQTVRAGRAGSAGDRGLGALDRRGQPSGTMPAGPRAWGDPEYPAALTELSDPPAVLYVRGRARVRGLRVADRRRSQLLGARRARSPGPRPRSGRRSASAW